MRKFWDNAYDYNDKVNGKPSTGGSFGFGNVSQDGKDLSDFGKFLGMVTDEQITGQSVNRFALP